MKADSKQRRCPVKENKLGKFINAKRQEHNISLRSLALTVGISSTYLSDIENGRRSRLSDEYLLKLADALNLNDDDRAKLFDLASEKNDTIPLDVSKFIKDNKEVLALLRQASKGDYEEFLKRIKDDDEK